jgi:hypothetical protein
MPHAQRSTRRRTIGRDPSAVAGVTFIYVQWRQVSNTATVSTTFLLIVLVVSQVAHLSLEGHEANIRAKTRTRCPPRNPLRKLSY